jgi:uncharacterized protein YdaU (DUF1376 family)
VNYYPFHIGDYLSATRHLSWEEDAAYRRLLDTYYTTEKPLPAELRAVCRLVLATTESQREAVEIVLGEFFELTPDGWVNRRADAEIQSMREKQQKQRDKANKRWQKPTEELGTAPAMPRHEENDATASKSHADAMPPTPTPTPTPTPVNTNTGASAKRGKPAAVMPEGVTESVWLDFLAIRKAKRAPLTQTALEDIQREASKAGMELQQVLQMCCARGWQGFNAEWAANAKPGATTPKALSFAERDELAKRRRWEEMTGRTWPTSGRPPEFTDIDTINQLALEAS